jgi:hypothetical protein
MRDTAMLYTYYSDYLNIVSTGNASKNEIRFHIGGWDKVASERLKITNNNVIIAANTASTSWSSMNTSSYSLYIDEVTGELKGTVRYSNGTTGLCTLCSITT